MSNFFDDENDSNLNNAADDTSENNGAQENQTDSSASSSPYSWYDEMASRKNEPDSSDGGENNTDGENLASQVPDNAQNTPDNAPQNTQNQPPNPYQQYPQNNNYPPAQNPQYPPQQGYQQPYNPQYQPQYPQQNQNPYASDGQYNSPQGWNNNPSGNFQNSYSATPYNFPQSNDGMNPYDGKKGHSSGLKVLSVLVVVAILLSGFGIGYSLINGGAPTVERDTTTAPKNEERTGVENGPKVNFNDPSAEGNNEVKPDELSSTSVFKKIKDSSVGILVYKASSQSLYTEGSGVIMGTDSDNVYTYIITCAHVISDAGIELRVQLADGEKYDAQLVGYDIRTDIGVLKIKAQGLKAAEFGDSTALEVGQKVYAIGNPGGSEFAGSFTSGMVSAIDRPIDSSTGYTMQCIQHEAAINPGNSGGALVNGYGQVVGINSMKIVDEYEGMGFAVPSSVFSKVVDQLIQHGYVPNRPKLGITYRPATDFREFSMIVQLKELPAGTIVIQGIGTDSALRGTDVKVNDMIIAVNGKNLDKPNYLLEFIENSKIGDEIELKLARVSANYKVSEFTIKVKLIEDKGTPAEEPTTQSALDDFEFPFNIK